MLVSRLSPLRRLLEEARVEEARHRRVGKCILYPVPLL